MDNRQTDARSQPPSLADRAALGRAWRRIAATVHLVTAMEDGKPRGMVATAVSSLSFDPPSLLVCINRGTSFHDMLAPGHEIAVNALHRDQQRLAELFAAPDRRDERFAGPDWDLTGTVPACLNAQAVFRCRVREMHVFGSHSVAMCEITEVSVRDALDPLLYVDGGFVGLPG